MTPDPESLRRLVRACAHLDAGQMHFVFALTCAMAESDAGTKAGLFVVMETHDHDLIMGWLRGHGWLTEGYELGSKSMAHVLRVDDAPGEYLN